MTLFDHHIHSDRSDGTVSLADRAKSVSVRPHGVSDHFPWRDKMRDDDDVRRYMDDAARLGLRVGLEYDLGVAPDLRATTRDGLHYMIGALHQLYVDGEWIHYDDAGAFLERAQAMGARFSVGSDTHFELRPLDKTMAMIRDARLDEARFLSGARVRKVSPSGRAPVRG